MSNIPIAKSILQLENHASCCQIELSKGGVGSEFRGPSGRGKVWATGLPRGIFSEVQLGN
jgi:hypothetical protein